MKNTVFFRSGVALSLGMISLAATSPLSAQQTPAEDELQTIEVPDMYGGGTEPDEYELFEVDASEDALTLPPAPTSNADELQRLFRLFSEALENKDYAEADVLAKQVLELSIKLNGLESSDSAKALTNLGIAQHNNKDYQSALLNFANSISIIESIDNMLSSQLINPLQGLAATHAALGRPDEARRSYQRAVHISHVNSGPHNHEQIETLESMIELDIAIGNYPQARDTKESIFSVQSRNIDPRSQELVPALLNKARWEHRLQSYGAERMTLRRAVNIIEKTDNKNSLALVEPLIDLGKSYLYYNPSEYSAHGNISPSSGEAYLRRADRIAREQAEDDWQLREDTLLSLGDYYILSGRPNRAARTYQQVWDLLSEGDDPEKLNNRKEHLETVTMLQDSILPKYYNSQRDNSSQPPDSFETGTITFSYSVSTSGRVLEMKHIETQPETATGFDPTVARVLRRRFYRPRMEDRRLVKTQDVFISHEFFYRPSDLKQPEEESVTDDTATE